MCATNDPLGQTHSPASSDHYSHLKIVMSCEILKSVDGQTTCAKIVTVAWWIKFLLPHTHTKIVIFKWIK